jgi:AraC-like DNA-binding protein
MASSIPRNRNVLRVWPSGPVARWHFSRHRPPSCVMPTYHSSFCGATRAQPNCASNCSRQRLPPQARHSGAYDGGSVELIWTPSGRQLCAAHVRGAAGCCQHRGRCRPGRPQREALHRALQGFGWHGAKTYCRILRLQRAVAWAEQGRRADWTRIALECGYFDQAHFIHDFRSFAGITPTGYDADRTQFRNHVKFLQSGAGVEVARCSYA